MEMFRSDLLNGDFMNPPDVNFLKHKTRQCNAGERENLARSMRKTSEEITPE
jgi:hypothetical protein